jgi:hypothetical protein
LEFAYYYTTIKYKTSIWIRPSIFFFVMRQKNCWLAMLYHTCCKKHIPLISCQDLLNCISYILEYWLTKLSFCIWVCKDFKNTLHILTWNCLVLYLVFVIWLLRFFTIFSTYKIVSTVYDLFVYIWWYD